jgi:hypothetical protein
MTKPNAVEPLYPPPTAEELAWWRPQDNRYHGLRFTSLFVFWGLSGLGHQLYQHSWHWVFAHPLRVSLVCVASGAFSTVLVQAVYAATSGSIDRDRMTTAIRNRRIDIALKTLPPD